MSQLTDGLDLPTVLESSFPDEGKAPAEAGQQSTPERGNGASSAADVPAGMVATDDGAAVSAAAALSNGPWDVFAAELADTARGANHKKRPCVYCGALTRAVSGVCLAHSDLPRFDPHTNVQAGRFSR